MARRHERHCGIQYFSSILPHEFPKNSQLTLSGFKNSWFFVSKNSYRVHLRPFLIDTVKYEFLVFRFQKLVLCSPYRWYKWGKYEFLVSRMCLMTHTRKCFFVFENSYFTVPIRNGLSRTFTSFQKHKTPKLVFYPTYKEWPYYVRCFVSMWQRVCQNTGWNFSIDDVHYFNCYMHVWFNYNSTSIERYSIASTSWQEEDSCALLCNSRDH